ncbi:hypothetical protein LOK49_LG03G00180 [Camellia lanceoleosa]|uniref:Uncharacterized protein n=1 Tax=Camellia lanceoleosa TaxID=1840588 RepID=A0ACC0IFA8_9ERIC|nr:hypothetical protein LOK49_LG03G00180 [Camellia lanceoleosa]
MELPRFVALKSINNNKYLRYVHEAGWIQGFLRFSARVVSSPYAKLEVEMAKTSNNGKRLVHIKCCFNNKYLVREAENKWWIVAGADEPEEDQSKWSCTLFEVLFVDGAIHPSIENVNKKIRFRHVQLGHYACLWRVTGPLNSCLYAGSEDFDENWCDIYTLIDCESVLSTPTSSMLAREEMALMSGTFVLKSNHNHKYLRYIHEYGPVHRFLRFSGEEVCSQYTKFELTRAMTSSGKGCVHIRCCYSNKYFVRKSANDPWIVAGADEPEEDRSKWSCTLFEPFYVDNDDDNDDAQTVRFRHVQLGCYACLWKEATPRDLCLCAGSPEPDKDQCDVYTIIDWESLLVLPPKDEAFTIENMTLPRFAVLKSNFNDKCLHYIHEDGEVHGFLQFSGEQVSSQYSKYELEKANTSSNGNVLVHIKCCYNNKYFVRWSPNHWWILATAEEPEEDQSKWSCTLFEPRRVSDFDAAQTTIGSVTQTIRLRHVQLGKYALLMRVTSAKSSCLYAASTELDKDQCDVFTIINWEMLSLVQPKSNAFTRETIALPRFVAIKSNYNGKYLRYIHEDGLEHEFVQFSGEEFVSPYTKYEVVMAKTNGGRGPFVHLRCCYNNKYLVKWSSMHRWIVAGADEPEEDQKQWSCTLFEPLYENVVAQTIRFRHVKAGSYVCLWRIASPHDFCLFAGNSMLDPDRRDLYTIIDWESLFILPKCVAFKGNNGKYLSPCSIKGHQYLHFSSSSDITDPMVCNEVITTPNGSVRIKSHHLGKFWGRNNQNWILADSDDSTSSSSSNNNNNNSSSISSVLTRIFIGRSEKGRNQKQKQENNSPESDMLFWPTKVGNNVVALRNLGNGKLCKILSSANGKINCLSAYVSTISTEVHLEVDETVTSRKIYNVNFRLRDARIYNRSILTLATEDAINRTQEPKTVDVKLSYSESQTCAWNTSVSLKLLGVKTTIQTTVPLIIAEGKIELSGEFSGDYQWGQTESLTTDEENLYKVSVPPMTMVRVNLIATKASCDIPFSYEQLDTTTLTDTQQITETMDDGIYTGSNCFDFKYETEQEML